MTSLWTIFTMGIFAGAGLLCGGLAFVGFLDILKALLFGGAAKLCGWIASKIKAWLAKRKAAQLDDYINWAKVPEWAVWASINADGSINYFEDSGYPPTRENRKYWAPGKYGYGWDPAAPRDAIIGPLPPWRESLRRRPGSEKASGKGASA